MKVDSKKLAPPRKGVNPRFEGVPGELVPIDGLPLCFGRGGHGSPYDPLLDQLAASGAGQALRFGDVRARSALTARAKKKGMRVSFAQHEGKLYVRYDGSASDDLKQSRRDRILAVLKVPQTAMTLTQRLREAGDTTVDATIVLAILAQMQRAGDVIEQEGQRWTLNPLKGKAARA